ncbi:hypothetical protein BDV09DRAFT_176184 [Aspergillus tetrazonus]
MITHGMASRSPASSFSNPTTLFSLMAVGWMASRHCPPRQKRPMCIFGSLCSLQQRNCISCILSQPRSSQIFRETLQIHGMLTPFCA